MSIVLTPAELANYNTVMAVITEAARQRKFQTLIPVESETNVIDKLVDEEGFRKTVGVDLRVTIKWGKPA